MKCKATKNQTSSRTSKEMGKKTKQKSAKRIKKKTNKSNKIIKSNKTIIKIDCITKQILRSKRKKQTNHLKTSLKKHENFFVFFVPGPENNKKIEKINFQNQMQSKHITAAP